MGERGTPVHEVRLDSEPGERWAATGAGLAVVVGLSALDAAWDANFPTAVVIGPFLAAVLASDRQTALVAAVAVVSCLLSGIWNDNAGGADYFLRTGVVAAGGAIAVVAARRRTRAARAEAVGLQLTAAVSNLAEAVIVYDDKLNMVYANEAAAETLGYPSAEELLATPRDELVQVADYYDDEGRRLDAETFPSTRAIRGDDPGPTTIRVVYHETGEVRWRTATARGVRDSAGRIRLAVTVFEDITDRRRAEVSQRLLARAGEVLASSLDYERTLQEVAGLAVPDLADWCGVSMPDRNGVIRQVAVVHGDPEKVRFAREFAARFPSRVTDETGGAQVLRTGESQLVPEIPDELIDQAVPDPEQRELIRDIGMRSVVIVPMVAASGPPAGIISFVNAESGRRFTEGDLELFEELGRRAGIAVENARLYEERSTIARTLQRALLPPALPDIPGFSLAALYRPAGRENWVGGDFYDAYAVADGWMVVVGDVAGRGAPAAALTAFTRHVLRTAAQLHDDPLDAIAWLNRQLYERAGPALCTVCCVFLRERGAEAEATIVCGGHPLPYAVRPGQGAKPVGRWGQMLGAWPEGKFPRTTTALGTGDMLVLYTDGVVDAVGERERFGDARLRDSIADASDPDDALRRIEDGLVEFEAGDQVDDTAALAIARTAVAASAQLDSAA